MEEVIDPEVKRERLGSYSHPPPPHHRMPQADAAGSHNYGPPPPGPAMQHSWQPTPSPYDGSDHRPPHEIPPHTPYQSSHYPPPHGRESLPPPGYGPDHGYSRPGSISAPTRSPAEGPHSHFQPVNGAVNDARYYQSQPPPEYRGHPPYGPPESPVTVAPPPPGLSINTVPPEMMSGHPHQGPPNYGPPSAGPHQYPAAYFGDQYPRRKPVRAAQACDSCRQRKAKCDEGRPECSYCKENNLKCSYREIPPQKQEKHVMALNEKLESVTQSQDDMRKSMEDRMDQLMEMIQHIAPADASQKNTANPPLSSSSGSRMKREPSQPSAPGLNQSFSSSAPAQSPQTSGNANIENFSEPFPSEHFTAAQELLEWPPVRNLFHPAKAPSKSYVMDLESHRGLLRLYGCGEGDDQNDGGQGAPSPAGSSVSSSGRVEEELTMPSPDGVWGSGHLPPPSPWLPPAGVDHPGGLSPHGGLNLDAALVDKCHQSYLDHMHILHPFLHAKVLKDMIQFFKRRYSRDVVWQQRIPGITGKRKRDYDQGSPGPTHESVSVTSHGPHKSAGRNSAPIEHSIANAIVLLVLALGKVCLHKEDLPAATLPQTVQPGPRMNSFADVQVHSPLHSAPPSPHSQTPNPRSGAREDGVNAAVSKTAAMTGKNMDQIPGLAYFARAADILGEHAGGIDVSHVQANLLAGLYMGQLARVFPSHHYIFSACRACIMLISSTDYKKGRLRNSRRILINLAFWSCLQLESDILAEFDALPNSGISKLEGKMIREGVVPSADGEGPAQIDVPPEILMFYLNQNQLRRTLNDVHRDLYKQPLSAPRTAPFSMMNACNASIEHWRKHLSPPGSSEDGCRDWSDNEHQSSNINVARMRAKYYGAKYIIHRPALAYALMANGNSTPRERPSDSPSGPSTGPELTSPAAPHSTVRYGQTAGPMAPPSRHSDSLDKQTLAAARTCVEAAIRSTTVFDKVKGRLIVTNIFGTAHAQFGNTLLLAAVHNSPNPELSALVSEADLRKLLDRTIAFLGRSENISPVLAHDGTILKTIKSRLFQDATSADMSITYSDFPST